MQLQSFLITERTDGLSKTGVGWLFFPSMNSNFFALSFSEYIRLLKKIQMQLKHMNVSGRFAKGPVF